MLLRSFKTLWCASTVAPERVVSGPNLLHVRVTLAMLATLHMVLKSDDPAALCSQETVLYTFLLFFLFFLLFFSMLSLACSPHDHEIGFPYCSRHGSQNGSMLIACDMPLTSKMVKDDALDNFYLYGIRLYSPTDIKIPVACLI